MYVVLGQPRHMLAQGRLDPSYGEPRTFGSVLARVPLLTTRLSQTLTRQNLYYLLYLPPAHCAYAQVEAWRGRCAVSRAKMIGHEQLELVRWDDAKPLTPANVVLLSTATIARLDAGGRDALPPEARAYIDATLRQVRRRDDW
jgi:hypothetical protein